MLSDLLFSQTIILKPKDIFTMMLRQVKAEKSQIEEAKTIKCLAFLLKTRLEQLIYYQNSCQLTFCRCRSNVVSSSISIIIFVILYIYLVTRLRTTAVEDCESTVGV